MGIVGWDNARNNTYSEGVNHPFTIEEQRERSIRLWKKAADYGAVIDAA